MAKNNVARKNTVVDDDDDLDFSDFLDDFPYGDDVDDGSDQALSTMMSANNTKMKYAVELTRIAVENSKEMSVDDVFSTFKKATAVIDETFPLNAMIEKILENQ